MPGGYRDININVRFDGIICEVQMHTAGHYVLKKELHPSYKRKHALNTGYHTGRNSNLLCKTWASGGCLYRAVTARTRNPLVPFCCYEHQRAVLPVDANGRLLLWAAVTTNRHSAGGPIWARWPLALVCQKGLLWADVLTN